MILLKQQKLQLFISIALMGMGSGHAQDAAKPSTPPVKDEFEAENRNRLRGRELYRQDFLKRFPNGTFQHDETPGSTGLKLVEASAVAEVAPTPFESLIYSALFSTDKGKTPTTSAVTTLTSRGTRYLFANGLADDYGYIFDPLWVGTKANRWMVMKAGRDEGPSGGYQIYGYQQSSGKIHRIQFGHYDNEPLKVSSDQRFLASVKRYNSELKQLWVWDSQTERNTVVSVNAWLQPSFRWKSATELLYSQIEPGDKHEGYDTYVWNAVTKKSRLLMANCRNFVPSPNGTLAICWTEASSTETESIYILKNLKTGKMVPIGRAALGKPDVFRQLLWSPDSRYVFSVLNQSTRTGMRVFAYEVVTGKSFLWLIIKPEVTPKILASSSQGKRIFLLLEQWINNGDGEPFRLPKNRHSIIEVETATGQQKLLWTRDGLWGLSENGIVLSKTLLQD